MIDGNEIDIAARAQALSKHINETSYFQLRSIEDFKDGARWAINEFLKNLWHDMNKQVPNYYKDCLVELEIPDPKTGCYDAKAYVVAQYEGTLDVYPSPWYGEEINNLIVEERGRVTRWLYIDDLLKGGNNG